MKHSISGSKVGTSIALMIDFRAYKKIFATQQEANDFFKSFLTLREAGDDDAVKTIMMLLNKKSRKAHQNGLEYDEQTGLVYLKGFNTPVPELLVSTIEDYYKNGYPMDNILNFWKLLMINPDKRVRESLFKFLTTYDFAITDNGYFVAYKAVAKYADEVNEELNQFVTDSAAHVRTAWKCSPAKYGVYTDADGVYHITKETTLASWANKDEMNVERVGNLKELADSIQIVQDDNIFIPLHVKSRKSAFNVDDELVTLGQPKTMERKECNSDPAYECSYGLHVGSTKYVQTFATASSTILVCLINPAHVIAVPNYDNTKMRVCEYFPIAIASRDDNGNIEAHEQSYYESDYMAYELSELEAQIEIINSQEKRITGDDIAAEEDRNLDEVLKVLKTRVIDLGEELWAN